MLRVNFLERSENHNVFEAKPENIEDIYQFIIENTNELFAVLNKNFKHEFINKSAYLKVLGYTEEDIIGKRPRDFVHPDDITLAVSAIKGGLISGDVTRKFRIKHKQGHYIWLEAKANLFKQKNGEFKIIFISRDITKSIQIEESEVKFRSLFEHSPYLILLLDASGRFVSLNRTALKYLKFGKDQLIGKHYRDIEILNQDDMKILESKFKDFLMKGSFSPFEFKLKQNSLNLYWVSIQANRVAIGEKQFVEIMIEDISRRKKAEVLLRQSEAKLRHLFDKSPSGIMIFDSKGNLISTNSTLIKKFSTLSPNDIVGKSFIDIIKLLKNSDELLKLFMKRYKAIRKGKIDGSIEFKIIKSDDTIIWFYWESSIVDIDDERYYQVILQDITEKKLSEDKFRESEAKFRNIIENTKEAIVIVGLEGKIKYVSPQLSRILKGRIINSTSRLFEYIHEEDVQQLKDFYIDVLKKKFNFDNVLEFRILTLENEYIWISSVSKNYFDDKGNIIGFISTIKEISDRKLAELRLKDSETKYRLITENANDLIRVLNKDFEIEFLNEVTHETVLGYSKEELLNKQDIYFNHPDDYRNINRFMMKVFKTGEGFHESRLKHKNGNYIWFEVKIRCFKDEQGQQKYLLVYRDINERKKTEQKLKESEEMFRIVYENAPTAIVLTDEKGFILEQNQASEKIFGFRADEIIGRKFQDFDVFTLDQIQLIKNTYYALLKGIKAKPRDLMIKKRDGSVAWINWQISILKQNELNLIETIAHDITKEKKAQLVIEKENEKLLELNKMKNELVSRVSHELKTPLNSIYGGAQILLNLHKNEISAEALEFVEMIYKGGSRLKKLVENLLDISIIESNYLVLDLKEHDISKIIKECVEDIMYFAREREIEISLHILENIICKIDKLRIEQVITNLLSNAIKNTPPKGSVKVALSQDEDNVFMSVQDTGVGLTLGEMDRLFSKFGKIERYGQRMNVDIEGTGLGLFISKEIIDLHKGSISVESEGKNRGSIFTVRLNKSFESN